MRTARIGAQPDALGFHPARQSTTMDKAARSMLTHARVWYAIDASLQRPGRLASQVSTVLQGKYKPIWHQSQDVGDHVVVINTKDVSFSGEKWDQKLYRRHTGYPGGFREVAAKDLHAKKPTEVIRKAVYGMLPRNKLRKTWMSRLHLFEGEEHPYAENIIATLKGSRDGVLPKEPAPWILRPLGDLHMLDGLIEEGYGDGKLLMHIPFDGKVWPPPEGGYSKKAGGKK